MALKEHVNAYWNSGADRYNSGISRFLRSSGTDGWKGLYSEYLGNDP